MIGDKRLYELGELTRQYEFTDVWKNNTLTQIKLAAYKAMMADGTIHIEKVVCRKKWRYGYHIYINRATWRSAQGDEGFFR